jgi:tetratricopeptide (TPR) repeat protein
VNDASQQFVRRFAGLAARRTGLAVGLCGEPGIGKTHAALALLRATPCQSITVHATQALEGIVRVIPRPKKISVWLERSLERLQRGEQIELATLVQTLAALLTANAPLILHVEDLHEADPQRLEFWQHLALVIIRMRGVGLIATSRAQPPNGFEMIRLEPLNREGSDALLAAEAGAALPIEALAWIFEHAAGNPLFTLEFFRFLARQGFLWNDAQRWRWRVPERQVMPVTVEAIIERVIAEACPDSTTRMALEARAYLESLQPNLRLEPELWADVANLEPAVFEHAERNLRAGGVLNESGFVHPLFREVAVKGMNARDRKLFANQALGILSHLALQAAPVLISTHLLAPTSAPGGPGALLAPTSAPGGPGALLAPTSAPGGPGALLAATPAPDGLAALEVAAVFIMDAQLGPERSLEWLERAVLAASEAGNGLQAARFQAQAVEFASGQKRAQLALEAAKGLRRTDAHEALRLAELALALSDDLSDAAEGLYLLADLHAQEHHVDQVEHLIARVSDDQRSTPMWLCQIVHLRSVAGNFDGALEVWRTHPEVQSDLTTLAVVSQTLYNVGEKDQAEALAAEALTRSDLSVEQRNELVNTQAIVQFGRGNMVRAEELFGETVRLARQTADPRRIAVALSNQCTARMNLGQYRESALDIEEALRLLASSGHRRLFAQTQVLLGVLQAELGNYEQAEELLLESLNMLEQSDTQGFLPSCIRALCDLYRDWAPPHGRVLALRHAQAGLRFARLQRSPRFLVNALPNAAAIEAWNGNAQRALELTQEALPLIAELGEPIYEMYVHVARGLALGALGQPDQALEAFNRAQTAATASDSMLELRKNGLEIARLLGNLEMARDHLVWFEERGLKNGVNIAQRFFPGLASSATKNTNPKSHWQLEVLGPMQLQLEGKVMPVRGGKRKELLTLLLEARIAGRREVSRLDLLDALYPNTDESQATSALSNVIHEVRDLCGTNTVLTSDGGYALGEIISDAERFLETGNTHLWRGEYLEGITVESNETVRETLHLALRNRAETLLETDPSEVARVGRLLCQADPYDLERLRLTLQALRALANHKSLARAYAQAREHLLEIGEVLPERWADFLEVPIGKTA